MLHTFGSSYIARVSGNRKGCNLGVFFVVAAMVLRPHYPLWRRQTLHFFLCYRLTGKETRRKDFVVEMIHLAGVRVVCGSAHACVLWHPCTSTCQWVCALFHTLCPSTNIFSRSSAEAKTYWSFSSFSVGCCAEVNVCKTDDIDTVLLVCDRRRHG